MEMRIRKDFSKYILQMITISQKILRLTCVHSNSDDMQLVVSTWHPVKYNSEATATELGGENFVHITFKYWPIEF